jgi:hypothetical protein
LALSIVTETPKLWLTETKASPKLFTNAVIVAASNLITSTKKHGIAKLKSTQLSRPNPEAEREAKAG